MILTFHEMDIIVKLIWYTHQCLFLHFITVADSVAVTYISEDIGNLSCHKCEETFVSRQWDPFTDCQINANSTPQVPCLKTDSYCMVERVSIKGMTTSIKRECASECYYGCRAKYFGVTTMYCTSCCQTSGCNTDNASNIQSLSPPLLMISLTVFIMINCRQTVNCRIT